MGLVRTKLPWDDDVTVPVDWMESDLSDEALGILVRLAGVVRKHGSGGPVPPEFIPKLLKHREEFIAVGLGSLVGAL